MSIPKFYGGRGIKNTFRFEKSLAVKSLWRGLFSPSMCSEIGKVKYLKHYTVLDWLRRDSVSLKGVSNF